MGYIGHTPTNAGTFYILDDITLGSGTTYTMQVGGVDVTPSADNLLITLDGVIQHAGDAYTVSGSNIVFASGPGSGVEFYGIIMGQSATVGQGSIGADELKVSGDGTNGQVLVSDGDGTFSWATDTENYLPLAGGTMSGAINLGSQNITNGGTITGTFVGNITGNVTGNTSGTAATVTGAAQSNITSVGTLTSLTTSGSTGSNYIGSFTNTSATGWGLFVKGGADNADYTLRIQDKDAADLLSVKAGGRVGVLTNDPSHTMVLKTDSGGSTNVLKIEEKDSTDAIVQLSFGGDYDEGSIHVYNGGTSKINLRGNGASYIKGGDLELESDGARFFVKSADEELVSIGRAGSSGASLDQGYIRMKSGGSNKIALHTAGDSYINGGSLGIGTDSPDSLLHAKVTTNTSQNIRIQNDDSLTTIGVSSDGYSFHTYQHSLYIVNWDGSNWLTKARWDSNGNLGIGHLSPQFGLTLAQGDTDAQAIGWEDGGNTKRASIYCGTSDDSLRLHVNGADRVKIETDGTLSCTGAFQPAGNVTVGGTVTIDGVSNYTGLEVKGSGGSRPQAKFTNVNNGNLGSIYATEGSALVFNTGTSLSTALTLDSEQAMHIDRRLSHNGLNVYVKDTDVASSSGSTFTILRSWHDTANWGQGMYLVEVFQYYPYASAHDYASWNCTYGYANSTTVVEQIANTGSINAPAWTGETTISGNLKMRNLEISIAAYHYVKIRVTTPDTYTSNVDNNNNNTVHIYP
jgi:hypothetical protein